MPALPPLVGKGSAAWHTLIIAGQAAPGIATVKPKKGLKVDKKAGLGEDGGTTTIQGRDVPSLTVTIRVWTQTQMEQLSALISDLFPAGESSPWQVSHPVLSILGISSILFESIDGPTQPEPGLWEVQLSACEFRKPKPSAGGGAYDPTTAKAAGDALHTAVKAVTKGTKTVLPKAQPNRKPRVSKADPPPKSGSWY
jgi:hypothetical protein